MTASPKPRPAPSKRLRKRRLAAVLSKVTKGEELSLYESAVAALLTRGKISIREVAEGSGVSKRTIEKIVSGHVADPFASSCEQIAGFFRAKNKRRS